MMKIFFQKQTWKTTTTLFCLGALFIFAFGKSNEKTEEVRVDNDNNLTNGTFEEPILSSNKEADELPLFRTWENFGVEDGLPSNKVTSVRIDYNRIWVGTDKGLAVYQDGQWDVITTEDGLSHNYILSIDVSELTGEVWIATMSGLNKWSAGKIVIYNQFNSGLANDVVYAIVCDRQYVWTATAAGASKFNTYTDQWEIFDVENAPMHEPWTYGIADGGDKIFIAAWGGGVIEYFKGSGRFRVHQDPDHQMEIDLYPDDGVVHDITTGVTFQNDVLWIGTYFGMSRYDGTHWNSYFEQDSGLASNFINFIKAQGQVVYICTDKGFSTFNGSRWATYKKNGGNGTISITEGNHTSEMSTSSSLPSNYIWGIDVSGDEIWLATSNGVSRARASGNVDL